MHLSSLHAGEDSWTRWAAGDPDAGLVYSMKSCGRFASVVAGGEQRSAWEETSTTGKWKAALEEGGLHTRALAVYIGPGQYAPMNSSAHGGLTRSGSAFSRMTFCWLNLCERVSKCLRILCSHDMENIRSSVASWHGIFMNTVLFSGDYHTTSARRARWRGYILPKSLFCL